MISRKQISGQAIAEYVVMFSLFLVVVFGLVFLLSVCFEYSWRVLDLFAWEPFN